MCGIAGIYFKDTDNPYLLDEEIEKLTDWLLVGIEPRGDHATGVSVIDRYGITSIEKADIPATKFCNWRRTLAPNPRAILMHTRWATKGSTTNLLNNHPIQYGAVTAIHNGHIKNDDELFKGEEIPRLAEVDSEIIPAMLNKYGFDEAQKVLESLEGNYAIAAFDSRNPEQLLLAKGPQSPLVYIETSGAIFWASTEKCLEEALQFGIGYEVKKSEIKSIPYGELMVIDGFDITVKKFSPKFKPMQYTSSAVSAIRTVYSDGWHMGGDDWCDICGREMRTTQLRKIGAHYYCYTCEKDTFKGEKFPEKKGKRWRKKMRKAMMAKRSTAGKPWVIETKNISNELDDEHWVVCELVSEKYGTTPEFIDHLLFSTDEIISTDDPAFASLFTAIEDEYTEVMKELTETSKDLVPYNPGQMIGL